MASFINIIIALSTFLLLLLLSLVVLVSLSASELSFSNTKCFWGDWRLVDRGSGESSRTEWSVVSSGSVSVDVSVHVSHVVPTHAIDMLKKTSGSVISLLMVVSGH